MRNIKEADLVVWVGPELEGFMAKPLAQHPHVLTLTQVPGMPLYNYATQGSMTIITMMTRIMTMPPTTTARTTRAMKGTTTKGWIPTSGWVQPRPR